MSDVSAVDYNDYVKSDYTLPTVSNKELGSDDFYKLLLAEIANQDPTDPMDNKDMVLQMSQFSALEGTKSLNENMSAYVDKATMSTAASLIGKDVVYLDADTSTYYKGTVSGVTKDSGGYNVVVDGYEVSMDNVTQVYAKTTTATTDTSKTSE